MSGGGTCGQRAGEDALPRHRCRVAIDWGQLKRLADGQQGLLTRAQCLSAGMSGDTLAWRVSSGRWVRVHEGVFQTRPGRVDWGTTGLAGLLYALSGSPVADAAWCGRTAAFAWGLVTRAPEEVQVLVPERRRVAEQPGVRIRRAFRFDRLVDERAYPWRTTRVATVLDVAAQGSPVDALSLVARGVQKNLVTAREILQELHDRGGHRHSKLLRHALAEVEQGAESGAEVLYIRDVERAHGLPGARRQWPIGGGRRCDNEYEEQAVVVEVDGRLGHEEWRDRVRDGRRDRQLLGRSRLATRVFFADVAVTPCDTAREIGAILASRGWQGRPRACRRSGCCLR
jgi:hypothetical protein